MGRQTHHMMGDRVELQIVYEIGTLGKCLVEEEKDSPSVLSLDLSSLTAGSLVLLIDVKEPLPPRTHLDQKAAPLSKLSDSSQGDSTSEEEYLAISADHKDVPSTALPVANATLDGTSADFPSDSEAKTELELEASFHMIQKADEQDDQEVVQTNDTECISKGLPIMNTTITPRDPHVGARAEGVVKSPESLKDDLFPEAILGSDVFSVARYREAKKKQSTEQPSAAAMNSVASSATDDGGSRARRHWRGLFLTQKVPVMKRPNSDNVALGAPPHGVDDSDLLTTAAEPPQLPPTRLHELCARQHVTSLELRKELSNRPDAICVKDSAGRLPLHVLSDNSFLVGTKHGRQIATEFGRHLIKIYPDALTVKNKTGRMPFVRMIEDWVTWIDSVSRQRKSTFSSSGTKSSSTLRLFKQLSPNKRYSSSELDMSSLPPLAPSSPLDTTCSSAPVSGPVLWVEVHWCLFMLSFAMDELSRVSGKFKRKEQSAKLYAKHIRARAALATHVAGIPDLLRTLLLLQDDCCGAEGSVKEPDRFERLPIFRRVLFCPESVGPWVTSMLRTAGFPARRAVDYLQLVSSTTVEDCVGAHHSFFSDQDLDEYRQARWSVFEAVDALEGIIPSLVALEEKETERASTTAVIWHSMNKNLRRPFAVAIVLIDFCMNITLLLCFRDFSIPHDRDVLTPKRPSEIAIAVCCNYLIRWTSQAAFLWALSRQVFWSYFTNIWTILDITSIVLTLGAISWIKYHPNHFLPAFNALVTGLLWLKVLSFLKVVNKQMATFILALFIIVRELRFVLLVLFVVVVMFGEMLHVLLYTKDEGSWCSDNAANLGPPAQDFCSPIAMNSYIRMYSLMVGDVSSEDWRETSGMALLFVIFTMFGIVILLNVIIAVVCDLYESARLRSELLFGRVRALFVAQNQAMELFLQPAAYPNAGFNLKPNAPKALVFGSYIFRWITKIFLLITAAGADGYLIIRAVHIVRHLHLDAGKVMELIFLILSACFLSLALITITIFPSTRLLKFSCCCDSLSRSTASLDAKIEVFLGFFSSYIFGLYNNTGGNDLDQKGSSEEIEWTGRLAFLQSAFEREFTSMKAEIVHELRAMESRFFEHGNVVEEDGLQ